MNPEIDRPWRALWALIIGFFMILVDSTIVSVAVPRLLEAFGGDVSRIVWVTSAYLLAYAVPLLITGRLGDRFGPKNLYLTGLATFTLASLWCGLTDTLTGLIAARVVQGLGAAMMSPQTMSIITRLFPAGQRGQAMGLWGSTAGIATLVGPVAGGLLLDTLGWRWIFYVNVPVGLVGLVLAWRLVPTLTTHRHRFDWLGVALSAVGLFCLVFGIEEGNTYHWGQIAGPVSVWSLIGLGLAVLAGFVVWQLRQRGEPLLPMALLANRNFSLANTAISFTGLAITAMPFPLMIWAQQVRGLSPTQAALFNAPTAIVSGILAPTIVGRLVDRAHPRILASFGLGTLAASLAFLAVELNTDWPLWLLVVPMTLMGVANAFIWGPISTTATITLPRHLSGAGAGVYNTTRQIGSVIGSAAVAALMQGLVAAHPLATAMAWSMWLPAAAALAGALVTLAFERPAHQVAMDAPAPVEA